jgi:amidase
VTIDSRELRLGRALCWNSAALNLAGLPAVALPAGAGADGLPVGVQLVGAAGSDEWLLAIASAVEAALDL